MKIKSHRIAEFMSFVNDNPFATQRQVVDHFISVSQDEVLREKMNLRMYSGRWKTVIRYTAQGWLTTQEVFEGPRSQAAKNLSYILYHHNSHLLVGGGNTQGPGLVDYVKRDDGKWGYILTPAGMGSLGAWLEKQKLSEVSQPE